MGVKRNFDILNELLHRTLARLGERAEAEARKTLLGHKLSARETL